MSNDFDRFLDSCDEAVSRMLIENKGDELTDNLVSALREALRTLQLDVSQDALR